MGNGLIRFAANGGPAPVVQVILCRSYDTFATLAELR